MNDFEKSLDRKLSGCTFIIAGIVLLRSCVVSGIETRLDEINKNLDNREVRTENVLGGPEPEKYIEYDGKRFFYEIDGKTINESYGK